jgi:hypothetical protein
MMLPDNAIDLINRAVDLELTEEERPLFEKLIAEKTEAQELYAELSEATNLIEQLPLEDPPWDIAGAVEAELQSRGTTSQMPGTRRVVWAMAAGLVIAVGILSLDIDTGTERDLVGTIALPDNQLSPLVYLEQGQGWAIAINIDGASDFQLLLEGMEANWQLKASDHKGLEIARAGPQIEIKGHGPMSIRLPLVQNKNMEQLSSPQLIGELVFEGRVYRGDLALRKNQ